MEIYRNDRSQYSTIMISTVRFNLLPIRLPAVSLRGTYYIILKKKIILEQQIKQKNLDSSGIYTTAHRHRHQHQSTIK